MQDLSISWKNWYCIGGGVCVPAVKDLNSISIICQKQMEVEVCSPTYFWISSSQSAIISHQVGFTSPWTTSSLCAKLCLPVNQESSSCAYCYQPKPPAICAFPNYSNWSPHCDSHVTGSVSTCQHKNCNWAAVLEWMQPALEEEKRIPETPESSNCV